jgi:hypothetical protein
VVHALYVRKEMSYFTKSFVGICFSLAMLASCSRGIASRSTLKEEFERDSGFKLPASATDLRVMIGDSDFHGDYSMELTFVVADPDAANFSSLPSSAWQHAEEYKPLASPHDMAMGLDEFKAPVGALFIEQKGPTDVIRRFAFDPATNRIYYSRDTW